MAKTKTKGKKLTLAQRARKDPELLKRVLANPGLRSKLPSSMLPPELRRQRELNVRMARPITPGSTVTERDLARDSRSAMDVKYGPVEEQQRVALGQEQARQRDLGGWYDQYLAAVAQHSQNVRNIGAQAGQIGLGLQQGVTGLGQAGLAQIQNPANAAAAATGMGPAGDLSGMANQALAVRQALTGSFVAQQAAQNAATQNYSDSLANVVAPGQKLGAMAQQAGKVKLAQGDITTTAKQRGADENLYRSERRAEEARQVLARQTLAGNLSDKETQRKLEEQRIEETNRANRADERQAATNAEQRAADAEQRRRDQQQAAEDRKTAQANKLITSGAFNGKTQGEVAAMTPAQRQKLVDKYNQRTGGADKDTGKQYREDFFKKYGVYPANASEVSKATNEVKQAGIWLDRLLKADDKGKKMSLAEAGRLLTVGGKTKKGDKIPAMRAVLIRAAMDMKQYDGKITPSTANRLHRAGFSVPGLGLATGSAPAKPKPAPPLNVSGNLGGFPK